MSASDVGLTQMVCEGFIDLDSLKRPTLTSNASYGELIAMRNETQRESLRPVGEISELFGNTAEVKPQKRKSAELAQLRMHPQLIQLTLPAVGDFPSRCISVQRPSHPSDALVVLFDADIISHVVAYMRSSVSAEAVSSKRTYTSGPSTGIWPCPGGFIVNCGFTTKRGAKKRRTKLVKDVDGAVHLLAQLPDNDESGDGDQGCDSGQQLVAAGDGDVDPQIGEAVAAEPVQDNSESDVD